jgi:hypothetical protein
MTGVPRLQHLPVPVASAGAPAVARPDGGAGRQVKPVEPVSPVRYGHAERGQADWNRADRGQGRVSEGADSRRERGLQRGGLNGEEATGNKPVTFSRLTSMPFMVQLLGQQAITGRSQAAQPQTSLSGHRDAALMGSDVYRRAGGEPELLPDGATFVRLAV